LVAVALVAFGAGFSSPSTAADAAAPVVAGAPPYCGILGRSPLLTGDVPAMERAVSERYAVAVQVSETQELIYSARPTFLWASEAKVACGMAIGYFSTREVNEEAISKCGCFFARMQRYGGMSPALSARY
jgi:hypothetical protein